MKHNTLEEYFSDTFEKIKKSPKPLDGVQPKGKKRNKQDYSKERDKKRNYED